MLLQKPQAFLQRPPEQSAHVPGIYPKYTSEPLCFHHILPKTANTNPASDILSRKGFIMTKTSAIRAVTFALAAACVASAFAVIGWIRVFRHKSELDGGYQRAYAQLSSDLSQMDSALQKLCVSGGSESQSVIAADIWMHAAAAEQCLEELPIAGSEFQQLETYINRVGDYAYSILRRSAAGEAMSNADRDTLRSLSSVSASITSALQDPSSANLDPNYFRAAAGQTAGLSDAVMSVESDFPESPVLLYDGPFSDHILSAVPACVEKNPEAMTSDAACSRVAKLFSVPAEQITLLGEVRGTLPAWCFSFKTSRGEVCLQLAKHGGGILLLLCDRSEGEVSLSREEGISAAERAAASLGFSGLEATYCYEEGGVLYVNFAAVKGDIRLYPDLVQIGISLTDGGLCYAEARGYLSNHKARSLVPVITPEEARSSLYDGCEVLSSHLCIIPTSGKLERLCYEFHTKQEDREFLIYIDAKTGSEMQVLQLLHLDGGDLIM